MTLLLVLLTCQDAPDRQRVHRTLEKILGSGEYDAGEETSNSDGRYEGGEPCAEHGGKGRGGRKGTCREGG